MRDDLDFVRVVREAGEHASEECRELELCETGVELGKDMREDEGKLYI